MAYCIWSKYQKLVISADLHLLDWVSVLWRSPSQQLMLPTWVWQIAWYLGCQHEYDRMGLPIWIWQWAANMSMTEWGCQYEYDSGLPTWVWQWGYQHEYDRVRLPTGGWQLSCQHEYDCWAANMSMTEWSCQYGYDSGLPIWVWQNGAANMGMTVWSCQHEYDRVRL